MPYPTVFINQVKRGPIAIVERFPVFKIIVQHHGMMQPEFFYFRRDVFPIAFVLEFRAMNTDHRKRFTYEFGFQILQPWE